MAGKGPDISVLLFAGWVCAACLLKDLQHVLVCSTGCTELPSPSLLSMMLVSPL